MTDTDEATAREMVEQIRKRVPGQDQFELGSGEAERLIAAALRAQRPRWTKENDNQEDKNGKTEDGHSCVCGMCGFVHDPAVPRQEI